eukprot:11183225-Ditylum_brightwellii.AAC.1
MKAHMWTYFCYNKTVVRQICWSQQHTILTPTHTLCADYNVQAHINTFLLSLTTPENAVYSIAHAKGHHQGPDLSRQAKLKNIADALTMEALKNLIWQQRNMPPPLYPASNIPLSINNNVITRSIDRKLQQAYISIAVQEYMEEKCNWSTVTADLIDWELIKFQHLQ